MIPTGHDTETDGTGQVDGWDLMAYGWDMININERLHGYGKEMTEILMGYDRVMDGMEHGYRWDMERQWTIGRDMTGIRTGHGQVTDET